MEKEKRRKRYRIKSKLRFTIFMVVVFVTMISTYQLIAGNQTADSLTKMTYQEIQIESGDNLWNLAKEFGPDGLDTRFVIREICKVNQISADQLVPGQIILIPDYI